MVNKAKVHKRTSKDVKKTVQGIPKKAEDNKKFMNNFSKEMRVLCADVHETTRVHIAKKVINVTTFVLDQLKIAKNYGIEITNEELREFWQVMLTSPLLINIEKQLNKLSEFSTNKDGRKKKNGSAN